MAVLARRGDAWRGAVGASGRLTLAADAPACAPGTVFDLASITKSFLAVTLARLDRRGVLGRETPLGDALPFLRDTASADATLDVLTAHRAGLAAHLRLWEVFGYGEASGRVLEPLDEGARERALVLSADARRAECAGAIPDEGFPVVYSDLGYLLAGAAIARAHGPLDAIIEAEVARPLGLGVGSARALRVAAAPTEIVPHRGGLLANVVHDENAFALAGLGVAGHAGLFGDAASVARLGAAVVDAMRGRADGFLTEREIRPLVCVRPNGSHRAGFDGRSGEAPSSGSRFGPATFGHLGFTGTSLWIDPDAEVVGVLLTNRVHPTREHVAIRAARPEAYDAMFEFAARALIE